QGGAFFSGNQLPFADVNTPQWDPPEPGVSRSYLAGGQNSVLREAADRAGFVIMHVKNSVQFGDLQKVFNSLRQPQELQLAAVVGYRGETGNQLADSRAVNIRNLAKV